MHVGRSHAKVSYDSADGNTFPVVLSGRNPAFPASPLGRHAHTVKRGASEPPPEEDPFAPTSAISRSLGSTLPPLESKLSEAGWCHPHRRFPTRPGRGEPVVWALLIICGSHRSSNAGCVIPSFQRTSG
ncbi:hypothetical protein CALVIDRAFT_98010 [Calocera viscosa TUFC12733]|uniref:Uncharacterized protein n=1 Tax=Calocera viscosa (strain TUFC12733) TaxID=1330018 RepID=A0A167MJC6_CALVF|nr:hypothetical protein CALVIDRAFT_98010 [Calocera viscosa TUFC12733]